MQGQIKSFLTKLSLSVLIMIAIFLLCLWGLFKVADTVFEDKSMVFDQKVFDLIRPWVSATNTKIMLVITFLGSQNFLLPANILLILFYLFVKEKRKTAFNILTISLTSVVAMFAIKFILQRERPLTPLIAKVHGYSFPSGHTFTSVTFYGIIAYIAYRNIKNKALRLATIILLAIFVLLIGFSRIYLGLHYATDVIAGLCLGTIWLVLAEWFLIKTEKTKLQENIIT
jgi:membrane-associated phospholipid phosphatase